MLTAQKSGFELELIQAGDAKSFYRLVQDNKERLKDFFAGTLALNSTPEASAKFIENAVKRSENREYHAFVIRNSEDQCIGFIDIKNIDLNIPKAEIGFFIDVAYGSKGLITSFLKTVMDYFFFELKFEKMYLRTHQDNASAKKVAQKLGFTEEGKIRKDYKTTDGQLVDLLYFGKLRHEHQNN